MNIPIPFLLICISSYIAILAWIFKMIHGDIKKIKELLDRHILEDAETQTAINTTLTSQVGLVEKIDEKIDNIVERTEDKIDKGIDKIENKIDKVEEKIEEKIEKIKRSY